MVPTCVKRATEDTTANGQGGCPLFMTPSSATPIAELNELATRKRDLRAAMLASRRALDDGARRLAALRVLGHLTAHLRDIDGVVAGYWPNRVELDIRPALSWLAARALTVALPLVREASAPLDFARWTPGAAMRRGNGASEPTILTPVGDPAVLLVPLVGFDSRGARLGHGAGYYDRTLAALRARGPVTAIGVAFAVQEAIEIPEGPLDQRLDAIVTELGFGWFR